MLTLGNTRKPLIITTTENGCEEIENRYHDKDGYTILKVDGKTVRAHRLVYVQNYGEIPEGLVLRHKCDNPRCVNVNHLELGTHSDNVSDRQLRGRSAIGEKNGRAKLTKEDVEYIKVNVDKYTDTDLALKFNVSRRSIYSIKNGINWK